MGLAPAEYVPLDRRFERAGVGDNHDYWAEVLSDGEKPRDWSWLRGQSRVVALLAQAGSGKTVEFQHQVDEARKAGKEAFFFRVERLCSGTLEEAHESPDCKARFERWLAGGFPAEIFLDAVDEAKLPRSRTSRPLRDAIRTLRFAIEHHLDRTALFVSCRSSEWFDDVEQKAFEELAEAVTQKSAVEEPITVFNATFAALDHGRIRQLAVARGAEDAIDVLVESEAIADIVTPLDAILYLDTYLEFRGTDALKAKFSSRGALLDSSVRRRLSEEGGEARRSQLELSSALRAAQFLAFASVAAQTRDIAIGGARKECIDPSELLAGGHAGLAPDSIRQLLACSLFVPAGQGRVRFYRQEARAMLAAQWLRDRIAEGASALRVTDQFIKVVFGSPRVPAVYGSMLGWLSSYDPVTRRRMIQAGPEWIIEDGDPRSLALEDRIAALARHVALGPNRFTGDFHFDVNELRRFAAPELELAVVAELAKLPPGDVLDQVIQICEAGRYPSAAPHLVSILTDFKRSASDRMFAIRALMVCGAPEDIRGVALHYVSTGGPDLRTSGEAFATSRNDSVLLDLVTAAYPGSIGAVDALALLAQLHGKNHAFVAKSFAAWTAAIPLDDLATWWIGLDQICFDADQTGKYKAFGHDMPKMQKRATILLRALSEVAARYIREAETFEFDRDLLIYDRIRHIRNAGSDYGTSRRGSPLPAALASRVAFRIGLYERLATVENRRSTVFTYQEHLMGSAYGDGAIGEDLAWLRQRYIECGGEARADYAESYLSLAQMFSVRWRKRRSLAWAALGQRHPDWPVAKSAIVAPLLLPWRRYRARRRFRGFDHDRGLKSVWRRLVSRCRFGTAVLQNWRGLRQGTATNLLIRLMLGQNVEGPDETAILARYGRYFGGMLIEGTKALARRFQPVDHTPSIYQNEILANLGFRYIWNADRAMTGVDPAAALRSALFHSVDWPDWATEVALLHPDTWIEVAIPLLHADLARGISSYPDFPGRSLSSMSHREEPLLAILSAPLLATIMALRVIDPVDIPPTGRILRADPATEARLPDYARLQALEAWHEGAVKRAMAWMPLWLARDERGLRTLLDWMETDPSLVVDGLSLYVRLYGEQSVNAGLELPALDIRYQFTVFAYDTINPRDDEPIREGVHSVTSRDDLQQLRSGVSNLLSASYDDAERAALERVLAAYIEPVSPVWAERWRNNYEKGAAKPSPWSHAQIAEFGNDLTAPPASGQSLLDRVVELVADLEAELATNEFDRCGLFTTSILEADFRAWLGHALDGRRRPWFSIVQEAETASEARTDLRLEQRGTGDALVIIEIKLVHKWSYQELLDKFRSQLVDRYLLNARTRHGLYLLVDVGGRPSGSMPDGSQPDIAALAAMLNADADQMRASGGPVAVTRVFTIAGSKRHAGRRQKAAAAKPAARGPRKKAK